MATISNTPRPGYAWDATDNVWYPIGTGTHGHPDYITQATAISPTTVDAKGDIIAATAADTVARLAVGANDTVLTADSSTATGLKWATAATGFEGLLTAEQSTYYVTTKPTTAVVITSSANPVTNTTYYVPVFLPTTTFDRIGTHVASVSTTANARLGLYNVSPTTGKPTTVVFDAGTVSLAASNTEYNITISQSISAGYYYLAFNKQSGDVDIRIYNEIPRALNSLSTSVQAGSTWMYGYSETGVTGAFATAGTLTASANNISLGLRIA
jgi:hypothetical protein